MNLLQKSQFLIFTLQLIFLQSIYAIEKQSDKPVRYLNPVFEKIEIQKDIEFGEVKNYEGKIEKLLLDIYSPQDDTLSKRPLFFLMHGGGFRPGNDKTQSYIVNLANDFSRRGYICISINYRIRENPKDDKKGTMTDALKDAIAGLDWIRKNHESLRIDPSKIVVGGGSAGGMLAVNFCFKDTSIAEKWDKSGIIALVNLWGSPDQSYMFSTIDKSDPPVIIVHGTADKLVPFENSLQLVKDLKSNNVRHELITLEGAEHTPVKLYNTFAEKIAAFIYPVSDKRFKISSV